MHRDVEKENELSSSDCMKIVTGKPSSTNITFLWENGNSESTLPYLHSSCHYFKGEEPEVIRFKGLNDEAIIKGYNLKPVKDAISSQRLQILKESVDSQESTTGKPIVIEIEIRDSL